MGLPGDCWTWSWPADGLPGLPPDWPHHCAADLDWWLDLAATQKPDLFLWESLLLPALIPEGAAGLCCSLKAQAFFIFQCEFRSAVPVLPGCRMPSSRVGVQSGSSKEGSSSRSSAVPLNQVGTPVFPDSRTATIWKKCFRKQFHCFVVGFFWHWFFCKGFCQSVLV